MENQNQITELQEAMGQTNDRRLYQRYQAVFLFFSGYKVKEITRIIGRSANTVRTYISTYTKEGIEGLQPGRSTGKPKKLTEEQERQLASVVADQLPSEVGFENRANWTLSIIAQYVKREWDISYSIKGMSIVMARLGLSYTRPTYTLAHADPEKQRKFNEETFPKLKKN